MARGSKKGFGPQLGGQFAKGGGRVAAGPSKAKAGRSARIAAAKEAIAQRTGSGGGGGGGGGGGRIEHAKKVLSQKVARESTVKQFDRSTKTMGHVKVGSAGHNPLIKPNTILKRPASAGSGAHPSSHTPPGGRSFQKKTLGQKVATHDTVKQWDRGTKTMGHVKVGSAGHNPHIKPDPFIPSSKTGPHPSSKLERARKVLDGKQQNGINPPSGSTLNFNTKRKTETPAASPTSWKGSAEKHKDTEAAHKTDAGWSKERVKQVHEKYTESVTKGLPTSKTPTVYMTGGGPASGKSTGLLENPKTGIPTSAKAAHVDPDGAKKHIPEYNAGVAAKDKTAAAFVHEESSHMAKSTMNGALSNGHDVVYDSVGDSGYKKLSGKVAEMRANGAKNIEAHYATVDVDEAIRRSDSRAAKTGRFVPHEYIREAHRDVSRTFRESVKEGLFDKADLWDTGGKQGDAPKHVASYTKSGGLKIHDKDAWSAFEERGK